MKTVDLKNYSFTGIEHGEIADLRTLDESDKHRILYAGVQFPLAESGELERELGSRHRAAVGLSAESDAVLMIISEETGDISVAEKGQLIRKLSPEALRGLLSDLLGGGDPPIRGKRHRNKAPKKADDTTLLAMRA